MYNPTTILQCLSTQAVYINIKYGQMFYYTDKAQLWVDTQNNLRVQCTDIYIMNYERNRLNFIPNNYEMWATEPQYLTNNQTLLSYAYVYVVETNCLYTYQFSSKTWNRIYGIYGSTMVAQTYLPNGDAIIVNADNVTTNGILNDGSVVIRDNNKMICGLLSSDGYVTNISSLVGGQVNVNPSGQYGDGTLQLNSNATNSYLANNLVVFGSIQATNKVNWAKQYRLATKDIEIIDTTILKSGSTIAANSVINGTTYTSDTQLTGDLEVENNSLIASGSKLYIGSIINNSSLNPPYMFDLNNEDLISVGINNSTLATNDVAVSGTKMTINIDINFSNLGDTIYLTSGKNMSNLKTIVLNTNTYNVIQVASDLGSTFRIVNYGNNNVKILP